MPASPKPELPVAVDLRALAREQKEWAGDAPLKAFERLSADLPALPGGGSDLVEPGVAWRVRAEWRQSVAQASAVPGVRDEPQLWLHLGVQTAVPQTCQRCLQPFAQAVEVDRWFRFVKDEATALSQDDEAEEDLLVFEPRFDLAALIEDELLMALPLVPMHAACPAPLQAPTAQNPAASAADARPHPFAALAALKTRSGQGGQGS